MAALVCAPVVLMGYRRPEMTARVLDAIRAAEPSELFLVMDGPKPDNWEDQRAVEATRAVVEAIDWDARVHRIFADKNMGLKARVSTGLDQVFERTERAIILEDDCLPSADFFRFTTELLDRYADKESVGLISGSSRLRGRSVSDSSYDFSADVRIWGWATWARTWQGFSGSGDLEKQWSPDEREALVAQFPTGARRKAMRSMLSGAGSLDSWALPFVAHCVGEGLLNPVPAKNLVTNIGLGESSTHTRFESWVAYQDFESLDFPLVHPPEVAVNPHLDALESSLDARELWAYPLRHPVEALRRVLRYLWLMVTSR